MMIHDHGLWSGDWLHLLWMILFWGGLISLAIWGVRTLFGTQFPGQSSARSAQDIANERYARGEITREEFLEISQDLKELAIHQPDQ